MNGECGRHLKGEHLSDGVAYVHSWAGVQLVGADQQWRRFGACVDEGAIPPGHRRRLGVFGRMAVACGLSLDHVEELDVVFCSRYGDMDTACKLLMELAVGGTLSPAGFSMSVLNASPGVIDLIRKSNVGHTAVAAGSQSLSAGLVEAWSRLKANPQGRVALIYSEMTLPTERTTRSDDDITGRALALELSLQSDPMAVAQLSLDLSASDEDRIEMPGSEALCDKILSALKVGAASCRRWASRGTKWSLKVPADAKD